MLHLALVYAEAKKLHPERWSGKTRNWSAVEEVWLNPDKVLVADNAILEKAS